VKDGDEENYEWYSSDEGMSERQFRALFGVPKDIADRGDP
jgi:hypothetical protein